MFFYLTSFDAPAFCVKNSLGSMYTGFNADLLWMFEFHETTETPDAFRTMRIARFDAMPL